MAAALVLVFPSALRAHGIEVHEHIARMAARDVWPGSDQSLAADQSPGGRSAWREFSIFLEGGIDNDRVSGTGIVEGAAEEDRGDPLLWGEASLTHPTGFNLFLSHFWDCDSADDATSGLALGQAPDAYSSRYDATIYWDGFAGAYAQRNFLNGALEFSLLNVPPIDTLYEILPAESYYFLGRIAHLLADAGVPAHVHLDSHPHVCPPGSCPDGFPSVQKDQFEEWVKGHFSLYTGLGNAVPASDLATLFFELAQRSDYFPSDSLLCDSMHSDCLDLQGDPIGYCPGDSSGLADPSEPAGADPLGLIDPTDEVCLTQFTGGALSDAELRLIADYLVPRTIEFTGALYRLFWDKVHPPPVITSASPVGPCIEIQWSLPGGGAAPTEVVVYRSEASGVQSPELIATMGSSETSYTDCGVEGGRIHYYRLTSRDLSPIDGEPRESNYSAEASAIPVGAVALSPLTADFGTRALGSTSSLDVTIGSTGGQPIGWNAAVVGSCPWVSSLGRPNSNTLRVTATTAALVPGVCDSCSVRVFDASDPTSFRDLPVLTCVTQDFLTETINATEDGWVDLANCPGCSDHCVDPELRVQCYASSCNDGDDSGGSLFTDLHAHVKFDIGRIPPNRMVSDAYVEGYVASVTDGGAFRLAQIRDGTQHQWAECSPTAERFFPTTSRDDSINISASDQGGYERFEGSEITDVVQRWVSGLDLANGFVLYVDNQAEVRFASAESSNPPRLVVSHGPNSAPLCDMPPILDADPGVPLTLDLRTVADDAETADSKLTYQVKYPESPSWVTIDSGVAHMLRVAPPSGSGGQTYAAEITVRDPGGLVNSSACAFGIQVVDKALPSISIDEPDGVGDVADGTFQIEWTDGDIDSDAAVHLFYDTDAMGDDGVQIVTAPYPLSEDANGSTGSYLWDTSGVDDGRYWIRGRISDGHSTAADYSDGPMIVDHGPPRVMHHVPTDGSLQVGAEAAIRVTFSEPMDESSTARAITITPTVGGCSVAWVGATFVCAPMTPLVAGESYAVTVSTAALDLAGNSLDGDGDGLSEGSPSDDYSFAFDVANAGLPPSPPTGVSASDGTFSDRVRVTWNGVSDATGYEVWRSTSAGSNGSRLATPSATGYDDFGALAGTTYYYRVRAINSAGPSTFSAPDSGLRAITYAVSTSASPTAGGTTSGGGIYAAGSQATVVASANTGYRFINWSEGGIPVSLLQSYSFTVDANRDLVASFARSGGPTSQFYGTLTVRLGGVPALSIPGSGVASISPPGSSSMLSRLTIPAGAFRTAVSLPVQNAFPIVLLRATGPRGHLSNQDIVLNGAGCTRTHPNVSCLGEGLNGFGGLSGVINLGIFFTTMHTPGSAITTGTNPAANLSIPLSIVGAGSTATSPNSIGIPVVVSGAGWTTGTIAVYDPSALGTLTAMGAQRASPYGNRTLTLVSPLQVYTGATLYAPSIAELTLVLPEPGAASLYLIATAVLIALGLNRKRNRPARGDEHSVVAQSRP